MGMKAYALDLRERVVKFIQAGGSKVEAGRRFELGRSTDYRKRHAGSLLDSVTTAADS